MGVMTWERRGRKIAGATRHGKKTPKGGCHPAAGPQSKSGKLVVSGGDLTIVLWDGGLETGILGAKG